MFFLFLTQIIFGITDSRNINIFNNCSVSPLWVAVKGTGYPNNQQDAVFRLEPAETNIVYVDDSWTGRVWAKLEDDKECLGENSAFCNYPTDEAPLTIAEFSFQGAHETLDSYSVSLIDGFNIPILIQPVGNEEHCKTAGKCFKDTNRLCKNEFSVRNENDQVVGCLPKSKTLKMFKKNCPQNRVYSDESMNIFQCNPLYYIVQFC